jgi:hypothetical protein
MALHGALDLCTTFSDGCSFTRAIPSLKYWPAKDQQWEPVHATQFQLYLLTRTTLEALPDERLANANPTMNALTGGRIRCAKLTQACQTENERYRLK